MEIDAYDVQNGNFNSQSSRSIPAGVFYQVIIKDPIANAQSIFTIPKRYTNLQFLNAGAQGTVVSANDMVTGQRVAIKKMQQPFVMTMSAKRAYREFILLTTIRHPNIIRLLNAFTPDRNINEFGEVYLVMELMNHNLHEVVHRLRLDHKTLSFFAYQMLCAIKHLHNSGIIHRDLKPSNIVVNDRCVLKVLDFGLARKKNVDTAMRMSEYVVTRYYRAPEVILGLPYSEKVDIWSVGCILAEMVNHQVLFPGKDRIDQWTKIINIMGTPDEGFISQLGQSAALYVRSLREAVARPLEEVVPNEHFLTETENPRANLTAHYARDLIARMLKINHLERCSVEEALNHPYVKLWFKEEEVNAPSSENRYDGEIDFAEKTLQEWKELIYQEVMRYQATHDIFNGV
ncbi:unnamed protein product [Caenorhabditis auriculariae]|uniref:Stress-activated protein kinase JNK n=1 Tax=Caenorhabditis auriculariae TaxID=2777116 RepID=A0A8S1HNE6_9PELO|nr:unnamed protein product [Caenorhabditis auriculariae]